MTQPVGKMESQISIPEWFAGKSVFITGATGFIGKVLVEKLLRDCDNLDRIYILVRAKRGIEPQQRRDDFVNQIVFDEIRQSNPKQLDKVHVLRGDVTIDDLGLSERDLNEVVKNVSVIFHCAANVRFDQTLKGAVNFNTFGTIRLLKVAEQIKNLKVFVHVSTAYCQCNEDVLLEQHYPAPHNPDGIIQMTKLLDDDILTQITPKLLDKLPNTYAYSKALTEDVVNSYADRIPIVIARPSIVSAAWKQPLPGWVEGVNGPTGLMIGAGRGVIRTMHCNASYKADVFPVDMTVNCLIALAWQRDQDASKGTIFCNITDSGDNSYTWGESIERGRQLIKKYPFCFSLWYPDGSIKVNYYYHLFCVIFFHYLPAYCIDALLFIFRKKPFLVKVQRKVSQGLKVIQYYTTKEWVFKNEHMKALAKSLSDSDRDRFYFDIKQMELDVFLENYLKGIRLYVLKEKPDTLPAARKLFKRLFYLDRMVTMLFYGLILWLVWTYLGVIFETFTFVLDGAVSVVAGK